MESIMKVIYFIITTYSLFLTAAQHDSFDLKEAIDKLDIDEVKLLVEQDPRCLNQIVPQSGSPLLYTLGLHPSFDSNTDKIQIKKLTTITRYLLGHPAVNLFYENDSGDNACMLCFMYTKPTQRIGLINFLQTKRFDPNHPSNEGNTSYAC